MSVLIDISRKPEPKVYKGINYIRISDLPNKQKAVYAEDQEKMELIKINTGDQVFHDCIPYSVYDNWYRSIYLQAENEEALINNKFQLVGERENNLYPKPQLSI